MASTRSRSSVEGRIASHARAHQMRELTKVVMISIFLGQKCRSLVEDQHPGLLRESARQYHFLTLAVTQLNNLSFRQGKSADVATRVQAAWPVRVTSAPRRGQIPVPLIFPACPQDPPRRPPMFFLCDLCGFWPTLRKCSITHEPR
jgi:hypothetical protein